jgi:hypothetical protein
MREVQFCVPAARQRAGITARRFCISVTVTAPIVALDSLSESKPWNYCQSRASTSVVTAVAALVDRSPLVVDHEAGALPNKGPGRSSVRGLRLCGLAESVKIRISAAIVTLSSAAHSIRMRSAVSTGARVGVSHVTSRHFAL